MKRNCLLCAVLFALVLTACTSSPPTSSPAPEASSPPEESLETSPETSPETLDAAELPELFRSLDPAQAVLTLEDLDAPPERYPADAARARQYLEDLETFTWEACPNQEDLSPGYCRRLEAPGVTLVSFGGDRCLYAAADDREGWFTLTTIENRQWSWMIEDVFTRWYQDAQTAALFRGEGTPLTAEELNEFEAYTASTDEAGVRPISCFFTSRYNDPRDLDAGEFLYYCPDKGCLGPEDEAEFQLVQEKLDWRSGEDGHLFSVTELPVPCHRLPQAHIDEILTQYAGITLADMHTDWREEAFYIPETDCFYSFASDFGPGSFEVRYGERQGDTVTLWETVYEGFTDKLTLRRQGDGWQVLSHQAAAVPGGTEENPAPEHP